MFQGFCPQTVDFMWGIRFNNEKVWFEAHKEDYLNYFYDPMRALARQVYAPLAEENKDLDLVSRVSRIYRDARRLRGRGPYKDRLWFSIERPSEDWTGDPVFWFELAPENHSFGLGYYLAPPLTMAKFRARLDRDPKPFEKLVRAFNRQSLFLLDGEDYKRPKAPAPSKLLEPWYNKRSFSLACTRPNEGELFTPALADTLLQGYRSLMPFYRYLLSLEGDPDPRGQ